jgi:hypothetical protein
MTVSGRPAVTDSREVHVYVADVDPVYTPKGARPIDPKWVRIHYAIDPASRAVTRVRIEVGGTPIGDWAKTRRHPDAYLRRSWQHDPATAPRWLADLVADYCPPGGGLGWPPRDATCADYPEGLTDMPGTTTIECVYFEAAPFHGLDQDELEPKYGALPAPFLAALGDVLRGTDRTTCWHCDAAVGFVLAENSAGFERLEWASTGLAREGDGPVAVLCENCTPYVPVVPD